MWLEQKRTKSTLLNNCTNPTNKWSGYIIEMKQINAGLFKRLYTSWKSDIFSEKQGGEEEELNRVHLRLPRQSTIWAAKTNKLLCPERAMRFSSKNSPEPWRTSSKVVLRTQIHMGS